MEIDILFEMSQDSGGKDPDKYSPTLKNYHKILWNKTLPNGKIFALKDSSKTGYLVYTDDERTIELSSDSVGNSYLQSSLRQTRLITNQIDPEEVRSFYGLNSTIGGFIVFPSKKIDNKMTINGARGFLSSIADRFDLTLECIKRTYEGAANPLDQVLRRYSEFFDLFGTFSGYVDFFLLNDLVNEDGSIKFYIKGMEPLIANSYPRSVDEYLEYRERSMEFINARNLRIKNSRQ